jgi:P-type Ca2+ transporter type 2C
MIDLHHAELVVGDIIHLETGNILPVDALVFQSNNLSADESSMTGETDMMPKKVPTTFEEHVNPFLISGSKIMGKK